jgi:Flp pilus assembly CpaE family ATPase
MITMKKPNNHEDIRGGIASVLDARLYDSLSKLVLQLGTEFEPCPVRSVMLVAAQPRSGVSYLASCIASMMAEDLGTTLLVDAISVLDFAHSGASIDRSLCKQVQSTKLSLLGSAGTYRRNKGTVEPSQIAAVLDPLYKEFDFIVVDAPAMRLNSAADKLAPHVVGSIVVVIPDETEMGEMRTARRRLTSRGGTILGAIYNVTSPAKECGR